jgi:hypothetical protein
MKHPLLVLSLLLSCCGEGTTPRPDDACEETRAFLLAQLERLVADQVVPAGTQACGEGSVASGTAPFGAALPAASVAQITSYFAERCAALAGCE